MDRPLRVCFCLTMGDAPKAAFVSTGVDIATFFSGLPAVVVEALVDHRFWRTDGSPCTGIVTVGPQMGLKVEGLYEFACRRIYHGINGPCRRAGSETAVARLNDILTEEKQEDHGENPDGFRDSHLSQCQETESASRDKASNICYADKINACTCRTRRLHLPNGYLVK